MMWWKLINNFIVATFTSILMGKVPKKTHTVFAICHHLLSTDFINQKLFGTWHVHTICQFPTVYFQFLSIINRQCIFLSKDTFFMYIFHYFWLLWPCFAISDNFLASSEYSWKHRIVCYMHVQIDSFILLYIYYIRILLLVIQ